MCLCASFSEFLVRIYICVYMRVGDYVGVCECVCWRGFSMLNSFPSKAVEYLMTLTPGREAEGFGRPRQHLGPTRLHSLSLIPLPSHLPLGLGPGPTTGTHKVLRPLRPRNMRPCTVSSWFPVSISSCTLAAPSKAPSRTSLILLLLRFLEGRHRIGENQKEQTVLIQGGNDLPCSCWGDRGLDGGRSLVLGSLTFGLQHLVQGAGTPALHR